MPDFSSSVLTDRDLPVAELHAARLDGELFEFDGVFCTVDTIDVPGVRAESIARRWPQRLIAEQHSAAWVLGALDAPPRRHELCADLRARSRPATLFGAHVREVVLEPDDIVRVGRLDVTVPTRTVVDLARFSEGFGPVERAVCVRLMLSSGGSLESCESMLDRRRSLPNKRRARSRLAAVAADLETALSARQLPVARWPVPGRMLSSS